MSGLLPVQLKSEQFKGYPPEARQIVISRIATLRQLPLAFLPLLLREAIVYDWKFPAERRELDHQLAYLGSLSAVRIQQLLARFAQLRLPPGLASIDWVNEPRKFSEQLTTELWATHQIDAFREAALEFGRKLEEATSPVPIPIPRLGIAVIGQGVAETNLPLFRKLRPWGVHFKHVKPADGNQILDATLTARANAHPVPFGHWHINGGEGHEILSPAVTSISYIALSRMRTAILAEMRKGIESGAGPEGLRTRLDQMRPEDLGQAGVQTDAILTRFQLSVLTEGSGTQLFSTTFVQWSAREALRRAQPLTLLARFGVRQRNQSMNDLISKPEDKPQLDPQGSLIDGDLGAYYTWIDQQRLTGAEHSSFLVWFEDHAEALAVGPSMPRGTESSSPIGMQQLLEELISG